MFNELLKLSIKDRNKIISGLSLETKKHIFNSIYTMTEELALDKVKDFSKRVQMRAELIEQFPDTVFWDYASCPNYNEIAHLEHTIVSTDGSIITLTKEFRLTIRHHKDSIHNGYKYYTIEGIKVPLHRCVATTFIPMPEKIRNLPLLKAYVNHKNNVRYDNHASNLEWVTAQENIKHGCGFDNYLEDEYFLFEVLADNGFKGRKFVMEYHETNIFNVRGNVIRRFAKGRCDHKWYGLHITQIKFKDINKYERGFPEDIKALWLKNKIYFDYKVKPLLGKVVIGEYKGIKFSLLGSTEVNKYFDQRTVLQVVKNGKGITYGCGFKRCSMKEAIPLHGKLTPEIVKTFDQFKIKKDKENK